MEAYMASTLEITVLTGEDFRVGRKTVRNNVFVAISVDSADSPTMEISSTEMNSEDGLENYISWNEKLVMNLPLHAKFLRMEVQCKTFWGIKSIGMAKIPLSDFVGGYFPENYLHFLSYRLRDCEGERNGIVNLSVKTKMAEVSFSNSQAVEGIPLVENRCNGGFVTGIPVWINQYS